MDKDISTLLREIKDATEWSEPHLAVELGTSQPTVNRILNGQKDCKIELLRAIEAMHKTRCRSARPGRRHTDPAKIMIAAVDQPLARKPA